MSKVFFTEDAARRIVAATVTVEGMALRDYGSVESRYRGDGDGGGAIALSKTTAQWTKGTSQELEIFEGDPPNEAAGTDPKKVTAWNHYADIGAGKKVIIGQAHTADDGTDVWYLLSVPCSKVEVVTDIQCVDGKMEVTKEFLWVVPYTDKAPADPAPAGSGH